MSTANVSPFILATYPETSPYDFTPLPFNITPRMPYVQDIIEFVEATRAQATESSINPLRGQFYENPYVYHDPEVEAAQVPFVGRPGHHMLPQASCAGPIEVGQRVEQMGGAEVIDVQIGGEKFLLKLFSAADFQGFERESKAYATLLHHGAHKRKAVLYCYGWIALTSEDIDNIDALDGVATSACRKGAPIYPNALLFEFPKDLSMVTLDTADTYIADNALRSLCVIHSAYVLYGSISTPRILIIDDETAVWFDFTRASVMIGETLRRQDALRELASAWDYFYTHLLPNQRIMWRRSGEDIAREIASQSMERLRSLTSSSTIVSTIDSAVSLPPSMRTTPFDIAKAVVLSYPQVSPFCVLPPLPNLRPSPLDFARDTPEFIAAAHTQAKRTGVNPLYWQHGLCPFIVDSEVFEEPISVTGYTVPPPLPQISGDTKFVILQQINESGNVPIFKVRLDGEPRLLKIFPDRDASTEKRPKDGNLNFNPIHNFERERNAYSHLLHYGVCASGLVPECFGWFELSSFHIANILSFPNISHTAMSLGYDTRPAKALVLEFVENATRLSAENITIDIADRVVRGLAAIHAAYVRHGDVAGRNVLVLPQGRVLWIDFDQALCGEGEGEREREQLSRQALLRELEGSWTLCYVSYLPDKRIGFKHWLY